MTKLMALHLLTGFGTIGASILAFINNQLALGVLSIGVFFSYLTLAFSVQYLVDLINQKR